MIATESEKPAWENPLMPNARLRQMYLAMMQARTMARVIAPRRGQRTTVSLEACLVSPAIDLGPGDLTSDALGGAAVDFLRDTSAAEKKKRRLTADCGQTASLPRSADSIERVWTAIGAAAALRSLAAGAKTHDNAVRPGVVVLYLLAGEVPPAFLKKALTLSQVQRLPILFVMLPTLTGSAKAGRICDLALRCKVPAMPTDAADAVAIYRVTQESLGHARIGGGPALIECIPFTLAGKRTETDAIAGLAQYMLPRKVVTQTWLDRETRAFAKRLALASPNA